MKRDKNMVKLDEFALENVVGGEEKDIPEEKERQRKPLQACLVGAVYFSAMSIIAHESVSLLIGTCRLGKRIIFGK